MSRDPRLPFIISLLLWMAAQQHALGADSRWDELRPDDGRQFMLSGKPLTVNGEYEAVLRYRKDFALGQEADDLVRLDQDLSLKFYYPWRESVALYAEASAVAEIDLYSEDGDKDTDTSLELDEAWIFFDRLLGRSVGLQIGRQNVAERREWWWDTELDAVRIFYDRDTWNLEMGLAERQTTNAIDDDFIEPEEDNLARGFARTNWEWADDHYVDAFFLYQDDHSATPEPGAVVDPSQEDEIDADLWWLGLRARGEHSLQNSGEINYWLDTAIVRGKETVLDFDDEDGQIVVTSVDHQNVTGWGFDLGLSWTTLLPWQPTFTLAYAQGSGDSNLDDRTDRSFQQTGLADNNGRFQGVNRFRYYGELLQPELSNLGIFTIAVGLPLLQDSSVELVYHYYRQREPAPFLRDSRIDIDPGGEDTDIGQEFDIVFGFEEWDDLELELIGSVFEAGEAYEDLSGKRAYRGFIQLNYSF